MGYKSPAYNVCNCNMKGKKTKRLSCGCCTAYNRKEEYQAKLANQSMRNQEEE